ncbi:MAG: adenylate/guanylate cyclase domain-containing protein [Cyanobacteria bacterium P01_G01_bin.54]
MGLLAMGILVSAIAVDHWGMFNLLEWAVRDQWVQWHTRANRDADIVVVTIDEQDIQQIGDWPIPDQYLAQLLRKIQRQGPTVIGMDLYRDLPEEPGHADLLAVYRTMPELVGIEKIVGDRVDPPPLLSEQGQVALADLVPDTDSTIRRALLSAIDAEDGDRVKLGLGAYVALQHLAKHHDITLEAIDAKQQIFQLGQTRFVPLRTGVAGYPQDELGGYQILLNWWGNTPSYTTVRFRDVLGDRVAVDLMRDRIVLIGSVASSTNDLFDTPYSLAPGTTRTPMPGVIIHANVASQLIQSALNGRPPLRGFSEPNQWLWISLWTVWGTFGSWAVAKTVTGTSPLGWWQSRVLWLSLFSLGGLGLGSYLLFTQSYVIPVAAPGFAFLTGVIGSSNAYKQRRLIETNQTLTHYSQTLEDLNAAYGHFVPAQFLSLLEKESIIDVQLGDQTEREMTVLFSDIRNFTSISEQMSPAENFRFINDYLSYMEPEIKRYQGFIDKYIGDAIMALFPHSADDALSSAIAMLQALEEYNLDRHKQGLNQLRVGIGVHTGKLMLGTVGSSERMDGTVIGNSVNLAARVEELTKTYGVSLLITHNTMANLSSYQGYDLRFIDRLKARGNTQAIALFEVFSADSPELRAAKVLTKSQFEAAVVLYKQAQFQDAKNRFQDCVNAHAGDQVATYYLAKCQNRLGEVR